MTKNNGRQDNPPTVDICLYTYMYVILTNVNHLFPRITLIGVFADTTVTENMESSDVHKAADRRHTRQKKTTKLISVSLPPSPVMMLNHQSQKSRSLWKLLGNRLRKAFFSDIDIHYTNICSVQVFKCGSFRACVTSVVPYQ